MTASQETPNVEIDFSTMSRNEKITLGTLAVGVLGFFGVMIAAGIKEEKRRAAEDRAWRERIEQKRQEKIDWMNEESAAGNQLYQLHDGAFLVVPNNVPQRVVIR